MVVKCRDSNSRCKGNSRIAGATMAALLSYKACVAGEREGKKRGGSKEIIQSGGRE